MLLCIPPLFLLQSSPRELWAMGGEGKECFENISMESDELRQKRGRRVKREKENEHWFSFS